MQEPIEPIDNVVHLKSCRLAAAGIFSVTTLAMTELVRFALLILNDSFKHGFLTPTGVFPVFLMLGASGLFGFYAIGALRKICTPDLLELSVTGLHYYRLGVVISGPWSSIGMLEERVGKVSQVVVPVAGRSLTLVPMEFGISSRELMGIITSARTGNLIVPEAWRAQNPAPAGK